MKMKRLVGFILIVCMTVGIFYPTGQVSAEADVTETTNPTYTLNGKEYEVYYEDDFSDGGTKYTEATAGFTISNYSYIMSVSENALMKNGADTQQYRALFTGIGEETNTNYTVSATFKMTDSANTRFTGVIAYANASGVGYEFGLVENSSGDYFRIYNRSKKGAAATVAGGASNLATTWFGTSFDVSENDEAKELTLRLEASTVDSVVTLVGYATWNGVEKEVCRVTSAENTNVNLLSGTPGVVSSENNSPISFVSITSLGEETDSNCLYSDDMTGQTGYRNALGYALSDTSCEYIWTNEMLTSNSSDNSIALYTGLDNSATMQNYTISADVVETEVTNKINGLVAYGAYTSANLDGTKGFEFALYQGKLRVYGRSTTSNPNTSVTIGSEDTGLPTYQYGDTVRLSMTVMTSAYDSETGTATVKVVCTATHVKTGDMVTVLNKSYTSQAIYQGAAGIRGNNSGGTIDNVRITSVGAQKMPYFEDFEDSASTITALYGSDFVVASETVAETEASTKYNRYGTLAAGKMVYLDNASTWTNYAVEADVTLNIDETSTSSQYAGLLVGATGTGSSNGVKGYEFDIYYEPSKTTQPYKARLYDHVEGDTVRTVRFDFTQGTAVKLRMEVSGARIKCYANDELLIDEQVTLRNGESAVKGSVGFRALVGSAEFDNISVVSYESVEEISEVNFPFVEDFEDARALLSARWNNGNILKLETEEENQHAILANYYMPEDAEEGYMTYDTSVTSMYLTGIEAAAKWTDYVYEADVTLTDDTIDGDTIWKVAAIVGAAQDSKGYEFGICYNGTSWGVRLYDRINDATLVGQNASSEDGYELCTFEFDETVRLKMVVSGNKIQCYVNDELKIDYVADAGTTFSGTIGLVALGNAAKFDNIIVSSAADYYPLAKYRSDDSNYTHPYKSGHVFGGWYTDAELTTALAAKATTTDTGCAYAKWVAEEVLSVRVQFPEKVVDDSGKTVMRILTTIDRDVYTLTGFDVSTKKQSKTYTDVNFYSSIKAKSGYESVAVDYTPDSGYFHSTSRYFSTIILHSLKASTEEALNNEFTIKPFWVTEDGTKVYGVTRKLTIQNYIDYKDDLENANPYSL